MLAKMESCCRSAYVRGVLSEKVRAEDKLSVMHLGAILDRLRD